MELNFKELIPTRKCKYETNNGFITVLYYNKNKSFIDKFISKFKEMKPKKIDLDDIGSFLWNHLDGKNTVKNLIDLTEEKFGESESKLEERVEIFLKQMNENHLITLYKKTS